MLDGIQMAEIIIIIVLALLHKSCNKCTAVFVLISFGKCQCIGYATDVASKCAKTTQQNSMVTLKSQLIIRAENCHT